MRITSIKISNYRSFDQVGQTVVFPSAVCLLVGRNNAGKSNILRALDIMLGPKSISYLKFDEEDFHDRSRPIELIVTIGNVVAGDKSDLMGLGLTKPQMGALAKKITTGDAEITIRIRRQPAGVPVPEEDGETENDLYELSLWGFNVFKKKDEIRHRLIRLLSVPAIRNVEDDLSASRWTVYGQLMKDVLESTASYAAINKDLEALNQKIQSAFAAIKKRLLAGARIVAYVDDLDFQLTKEGKPSELLRYLQIVIKEQGKWMNLDNFGTGTQSAVIIGVLEVALKNKASSHRLFCIEEPEAFIHPHGSRYLGDLIRAVPRDNKTQVLVSTHSLSLLCSFAPEQIIRVEKTGGATRVHQSSAVSSPHLKRFIHQDNAELFFSDRVVFVEGPTEKVLFTSLDKRTKVDPVNPGSENCNFDRRNIGVVRLDSKDSILNYTKIANEFGIKYCAILDKDFLGSAKCKELCAELGVTYQTVDQTQLIADLRSKRVIVISAGEIEDVFPDSDIAAVSGKAIAQVQAAKTKHPGKTSRAFKEIFGVGKHEYAIRLADYYGAALSSPLADTIRKIYLDDTQSIAL